MKRRVVFALVAIALCVMVAMPAVAQKVKLTVWGRDLADGEPDHAYVTALIKQFQAKNPNITLDYVPLGDPGLADKTKIAMAAGNGMPDIFQSWGGSTMGGYADAGRLLDLTAELESVPGSAAAQNAMTWKGKIYGVAPFFAICGVFINEGIFKANNLTVPTSVDQFEKVADTLKAKGLQPFACGQGQMAPAAPLHVLRGPLRRQRRVLPGRRTAHQESKI
jgi:raffinose/stachyose/melibiose transport system substrate-binding protein